MQIHLSSANSYDTDNNKIVKMIGGTKHRIKPKPPASSLPEFDDIGMGWPQHDVVVKDGKVYDAFTGHIGETISDYKARWTDSEFIDWPF